MRFEVDAEHRLGTEDPGQVRGVGEPELPPGEEGPACEQRVEPGELGVEPVSGVLLSSAERVVGAAEPVEALEEETAGARSAGSAGQSGAPDSAPRGTP